MESLTRRVAAAERVALDTEADSLHSYFEKICLIQLSLNGQHFLVDTLCGLELGEFLAALAEKPLILHGGDYDLRMLGTSAGFRPRREVFDTMIAAQLLGFEQLGLAALIARFFELEMSKAGQKSDWSRRPLSDKQLSYAVNDTRFLARLADLLRGELDSKGRIDWLRESCAAMVEATGKNSVRDSGEAWRIKGAGRLTRRQLAYLRELWRWRDAQARSVNLPAFRVLGSQELLEWAQWAESHPGAPVTQGPKLPRHIYGARLFALEAAIARALETEENDWPVPRTRAREAPRRDSSEKIEQLRAESARLAEALQIAPSILLPRAALEAIAREKPRSVEEIMACGGLLRWQAELLRSAVEICLYGSPVQFDPAPRIVL